MPIDPMQGRTEYRLSQTAGDFWRDESTFQIQMGPIGCGKSVSCCQKLMKLAHMQKPGNDGIRRTRWAIVRNTYPELKSTTIKTWEEWFPPQIFGAINSAAPITQHIRRGDVDAEFIFLAIDGPKDLSKLMSLELTGAYLNEAQYFPYEVFERCLQRADRYPPVKKYGVAATWQGVIADTNPPDMDHWIYRLMEVDKPSTYKMFRYAPAVIQVDDIPKNGVLNVDFAISLDGDIYITNPHADYVHLASNRLYWIRKVAGYRKEQIKVFLQGDYGIVCDGRRVHPEYNDILHRSIKPLTYDPSLPLLLGWDFGMTPACCIGQIKQNGQLQILAEVWTDYMNLSSFIENHVLPLLNRKFVGWHKNYESVHDPAGQSGGQEEGKSCQQIMDMHKIRSYPAGRDNSPTPRREGAKWFFNRMIGGEPAILFDPAIKHLRTGLLSKFQYMRVNVSGEERYHDKPQKNIYSHIGEAFEYLCMVNAYMDRTVTKKTNYDLGSRIC